MNGGDRARVREIAAVDRVSGVGEGFHETTVRATVRKYDAATLHRAGLLYPVGRGGIRPVSYRMATTRPDDLAAIGVEPYEVIEGTPGNLLPYGGGSAFWDLLIGAGNVTAYNNANAYIGVGNSNTAAADTQTDLQGTNNRQGMEASYPGHTDGTTSGSEECDFQAQWGTGDGNFAWEEWGVFNHASIGRMLNRKVESLGTKSSGSTWTLTATLSLS